MANVEAIQARPHTTAHRVEEKLYQGGDLDVRINYLQAELEDVMKISKSGRYSSRTAASQEETKAGNARYAMLRVILPAGFFIHPSE